MGLSGGFYFDDEWNIIRNQALHLDSFELEGLWNAALSGTAGPLGRPLAMLSFAINHIFFGLDPFYFKLVNLFLHIFCGWAIYVLSFTLSGYLPRIDVERRHFFAFLVMMLWLLHPLNLTPVLYSVQRMTGLSALFCLLSIITYLKARQCDALQWIKRIALYVCSLLVFWPLALASKENAALLPAFLFLIELIFLKFRKQDRSEKSFALIYTYAGLLIIPAVLIVFYCLVFPEWILGGYARRDFGFYERLLTESRVLIFYVGQLFFPLNSSLGIFHDDFSISKSLLSPWTTLPALIFIGLSVSWAFMQVRKLPVVAFGILFFFLAHALESSVFSLELVHEHRNYLASFSILFVVAYYLVVDLNKASKICYLLAGLLVAFLSVTTLARAAVWGAPVVHAISELSDHPQSPRANYSMGKRFAVYASSIKTSPKKNEAIQKAAEAFRRSAELRDSYTDGLFGLLLLEGIEGYAMGQQDYLELLNRLASAPFSSNNYNYLNSVLSCVESNDCKIAKSKVAALIEASLKNPGFYGKHKSQILRRFQEYVSDP